jgi:cbb3-type cytochrome oxidase subunit 3
MEVDAVVHAAAFVLVVLEALLLIACMAWMLWRGRSR